MEERRTPGPVRTLQTMLRAVAEVNGGIMPAPRANGVFGETTLEAVMTFQRENGIPVTGQVDGETWDALIRSYGRACQTLCGCSGTDLFPFPLERVEPGQSTPMLLPIQAMFCALSEFLTGIRAEDPCGALDEATADHIRWLQARTGLPVTGAMDRDTCDSLSRVYETFVARSPRCEITGT